PACERFHLALEQPDLLAKRILLQLAVVVAGSQVVVVTPPVKADLLRLVDRANDQPDPDREQLDLRERHLDIAGDHKTFVEHAIENVQDRKSTRLNSSLLV